MYNEKFYEDVFLIKLNSVVFATDLEKNCENENIACPTLILYFIYIYSLIKAIGQDKFSG